MKINNYILVSILSTAVTFNASVAHAQDTDGMHFLGSDIKLRQTKCFKLPVDYDYGNMRYVMTNNNDSTGSRYIIGSMKRKAFVKDVNAIYRHADYGHNTGNTVYYQTNDDRVLAQPVAGMLRELTLFSNVGRIYLASNIVREARKIRKDTSTVMSFNVKRQMTVTNVLKSCEGHFEIEISITPDTSRTSTLLLCNENGDSCHICFDMTVGKLTIKDAESEIGSAPLDLCEGGTFRLDIFVNKNHLDVFVDEGRIAVNGNLKQHKPFSTICFSSTGGKTKFGGINVYRL